jgi:hypothetical protein
MLKIRVSGSCSLSAVLYVILCLNAPRKQAPRTVNYVINQLTIQLATFCATQLSHVVN